MPNLVNIAKETGAPILMDADAIALIIKGHEAEQPLLNFYSHSPEKEDRLLGLNPDQWGISMEDYIDRFKAAGCDLFTIPYIWGDGTKLGTAYINPDAVSAVIASAPNKDGNIALLIHVDGYGRFESYAVPSTLADQFLAKIVENRPDFSYIDPIVATSHFYEQAYTAYDPQKISQIVCNGYDVDVLMENGRRIGFNITTQHPYENNLRLREDFAALVAQKAQGLVKLKSADVFYTRLDDVTKMSQHTEKLTFHYKQAKEMIGSSLTARFKSAEEARAEMERLLKLKSPPGFAP